MERIDDLNSCKERNYKKDEIILFTAGEHYEYDVMGLYIVIKDFSLSDVQKATKTDMYSNLEWTGKLHEGINTLKKLGFIKKLRYSEVWLEGFLFEIEKLD